MRALKEDLAQSRPGPKRPYHSPELLTYGDFRSVTENIGTMSAAADGPGPMSKTA